MTTSIEYETRDNGGRPFTVKISDDKKVQVYKSEWDDEDNHSLVLLQTYHPEEILIGKSPLNDVTKFSGAHGPEYDGNSILLHLGELKYVFIGDSMYSFSTKHSIVKLISPIGNSDVPYPYAYDNSENKNYYLLSHSEHVTFPTSSLDSKFDPNDPYTLYWNYQGCSNVTQPKSKYIGMRKWGIGFNSEPIDHFERETNIRDPSKNIDMYDRIIDLMYKGVRSYAKDNEYLESVLQKYESNPDDLPDEELIKVFQNYEFFTREYIKIDEDKDYIDKNGYTRNKAKVYVEYEHCKPITDNKVDNPYGNYNVLKSMSKKYHDTLTNRQKYDKISYMSVIIDGKLIFLTKESYAKICEEMGKSKYGFQILNNYNVIQERW